MRDALSPTTDGVSSSNAIERKLAALAHTGRMLKALFYVLAGLFAVLGVVSVVVLTANALSGGVESDGVGGLSPFSVLSVVAFALFAAIFLTVGLMFKDISLGESPFTEKQVRRIRTIAWLLFAYAVLDTAIPKGLVMGDGLVANTVSVVRFDRGYTAVNIGMFVSAVILYSLSSVFRYGALLQKTSDELV